MGRQAYILVTVLLLLACRPSSARPDAAQNSPSTAPERAGVTDGSGSDSEAGAQPETSSLETTTGSGALTGVLLLRTVDGFQPVVDVKLALGETLSDDEGTERVVAYDPSAAPVAYTDSSGRFLFENLQSGRYGLILDTVLSASLLYQEGTDNAILFDITDDEMTDLGNLEYSELPLPQSSR